MEANKEKCTTCDGTGEVHSHNLRCWSCSGRGYVARTYAGQGALIADEVLVAELRKVLQRHEDDSEQRLLNLGWRFFRKDVTRTPEADLPPVVRERPTSKTRRTLALIDALLELKGYDRDQITHDQTKS